MPIVPPSAKLQAPREAAKLGLEALDRGEFKEFNDVRELERYLLKRSNELIFKARLPQSPR